MRHVLLALLISLPAPELSACPGNGFALRDLVELAQHIVLVEVLELHQVADTEVAEVAVVRTLKGAPPARFFHPSDLAYGTERPLRAGSRVLLFLTESDDYAGTRSFWKELDRLRAGEAFFDLAFVGAFPFSDDGDAPSVPGFVELPETVPATLQDPGREAPGSQVDMAALILEIEALVSEEASPIE